jgi:Ni,Fe-hydrogenase I small subunit
MSRAAHNIHVIEAITGCASWGEIHAKWASFTEKEKGDRFEDLT